jgi:Zn-dependent M28 family amino/carboxypeptidase
LSGESVLFTAHLDHQGLGPPIKGDTIYNGAYDNAIGVAMMLEAARSLGAEEPKPRRTVVFAAVTAEEKGLVGSDYLAQHLPASLGRPIANLNLDMVLVSSPARSYTILGMEHSTLREPVEAAAKRFEIQLQPDPEPERVTFIRSDQYSFVRRGVPAIFPKIFAPKNSESGTEWISPAGFLKQHYHQPSDDLSLPRHGDSTVRFVRFMTEVARQVANAERAPKWNEGDFFGETFARD